MENVCPYCGSRDIEIGSITFASAHRGFAFVGCPEHKLKLFVEVPDVIEGIFDAGAYVRNQLIPMFCHPAHLHAYDPATQLLIGRGDAIAGVDWIIDGINEIARLNGSMRVVETLDDAADVFRAALEGK